jgi:glycosyltransferase involved in cell wall biosynthesis
MRIGIVPFIKGSGGGIYQYSLNMLRALWELKIDGYDDEFVVFAHKIHRSSVLSPNRWGWVVKPLYPRSLKRMAEGAIELVIGEEYGFDILSKVQYRLKQMTKQFDVDAVLFQADVRSWFLSHGVDLMLYPFPTSLSFETGIPYVMAIHDLQHRLQPEFPEVSSKGRWEWREYLFRNGARYATLLLADSEVGKEDILNFYGPYGATPDRVKVLPFLPASYLTVDVPESERQRVRTTYCLPERYLFYPAQFWPHKNHARLVQALEYLKRTKGLEIPVVFCGSYQGEIREQYFRLVMNMARHCGVADLVHYLGYVPDEDMSGLYAAAVALVIPTCFGPTNIPILEAWAFGCPVLTSDIRGIREQVGDAAVLVDPRSVEAIAQGIYRLWIDERLRRTLANQGRQRLSSYNPDDYRRQLIKILEEAKARVKSEGPRIN